LTLIEETVPSGSVAVKVTVTGTLLLTGLGITEEIDTTGGLSLTVSVVLPKPGPALFVAVTMIVKICDFVAPVDV
jgi:hypothetical protein